MLENNETRGARIERYVRRKEHIIRCATGAEKADLVFKNARYVNVFSKEVARGDIAVTDGIIVGIGDYEGKKEIDCGDKTLVPGLIDAHIHIESSLVSPASFARAVLPHGTTAVITDPHEIANVCGVAGIEYMLRETENLPLDVYFMLSSCVPSVPFEENGQKITWHDMDEYLTHPRVLGLAEMMNYPGVVNCDREVLEKIVLSQAHHKKIDGHAPGLSGKALNGYIAAGVYSDHECDTLENAMEKLRMGQYIMIREGTAAQNLEALVSLLQPRYALRCMFCTDDKHPADLLEKGHIDYIIRKAVALGADPILAVVAATLSPARYFKLNNRGALAPGYMADIAVVDNLTDFNVLEVYKAGEKTGCGTKFESSAADEELKAAVSRSVHMGRAEDGTFSAGKMPLIGLVSRQIVTRNLGFAENVDTEKDILKMCVLERHHNTGHRACCYLSGYGLKQGAVATSIAHDSHNIVVCGANDEDMALAVNAVRDMQGGIAVVRDGKIMAELSLPIAGLMSEEPLESVNTALENCKEEAFRLGISHDIDPFMTLSFASLPVIPTLRLLTTGVFDVENQKFVEA